MNISKRWVAAGLLAVLAAIGVYTFNVPTDLTAEDRKYLEKILVDTGNGALVAKNASRLPFDGQLSAILKAQHAVLSISAADEAIDFDHEREPKDLYFLRGGFCYDRARALQKMYRYLGFSVRYVSVFALEHDRSAASTVLSPGAQSHALVNVRTRKGWMAVDSLSRWIGLTRSGRPVSVTDLHEHPALAAAGWREPGGGAMHWIFKGPFTYVIGLYSRHGRFYPPYVPIPDVNVGEFLRNILE